MTELKDASKMGIVAEGVRVEWDKFRNTKKSDYQIERRWCLAHHEGS